VLSRTIISEHIWDYNFDTGTNIIDVYVNHLRNKIDEGFEPKLIHTVRGVGYVMRETNRGFLVSVHTHQTHRLVHPAHAVDARRLWGGGLLLHAQSAFGQPRPLAPE